MVSCVNMFFSFAGPWSTETLDAWTVPGVNSFREARADRPRSRRRSQKGQETKRRQEIADHITCHSCQIQHYLFNKLIVSLHFIFWINSSLNYFAVLIFTTWYSFHANDYTFILSHNLNQLYDAIIRWKPSKTMWHIFIFIVTKVYQPTDWYNIM